MISKSAPNNPLIKDIKKWKKDQAIISLTLEEMKEEAKGKEIISEQKVDGQSAILSYKEGTGSQFGSLGGVLYLDLPVLEEATKAFKSKNIKQVKIVGELAGYDKKILPFNETESIIKNPKTDKTKLHWFPYQILELNNEKIKDDFKTYKETWPEIEKIFKGAKYIQPVEYFEGDIDKAWNKSVKKEKNEGIIVRLSNNKVYKIKPTYTYDLVIIAVGDKKKGKNWPKKMISMALGAFMDNNKVFRTVGHVASGFNDQESKELFSWAQKNMVDEDNTYVWVKPKKIMEVQWERSHLKDMPAYEYSKGIYKSVGKKLSGTIVKPRFIKYRTDKSVTPEDLRLTQIPDWSKRQKMAKDIVHIYLSSQWITYEIPEALNRAITGISNKMETVFKYKLPSDVEWRTYNHPDYKKDSKDCSVKDPAGFISKDSKKIYFIKLKSGCTYEDFVAHELGHFLDRHLNNFSLKTDVSLAKYSPKEIFAMMVNYVLVDEHSGGPIQTKMYNAVCDKLSITNRVKPGVI